MEIVILVLWDYSWCIIENYNMHALLPRILPNVLGCFSQSQ